jgi:hypothetical protein
MIIKYPYTKIVSTLPFCKAKNLRKPLALFSVICYLVGNARETKKLPERGGSGCFFLLNTHSVSHYTITNGNPRHLPEYADMPATVNRHQATETSSRSLRISAAHRRQAHRGSGRRLQRLVTRAHAPA